LTKEECEEGGKEGGRKGERVGQQKNVCPFLCYLFLLILFFDEGWIEVLLLASSSSSSSFDT